MPEKDTNAKRKNVNISSLSKLTGPLVVVKKMSIIPISLVSLGTSGLSYENVIILKRRSGEPP
jgi:hypothetical protein